MTYNSENQFRCTIVRGKSYIDLDNLLSVYASIIESTCPCDESSFEKEFNYNSDCWDRAKGMEKEQLCYFYIKGVEGEMSNPYITNIEFYNKTFKSKQ